MSETLGLALGCLMAMVLFLYTFWPENAFASQRQKTRLDYLEERKEQLYENLRDLNFEYKAGKYPEEDFLAQRSQLENETAQLLAESRPLNARERRQWSRFQKKAGRPRIGRGTTNISISLEKGLLREFDRFARKASSAPMNTKIEAASISVRSDTGVDSAGGSARRCAVTSGIGTFVRVGSLASRLGARSVSAIAALTPMPP